MPACIFLSGRVLCHIASCMPPSVIVWDLEAVPDLAGFAAANDLFGKSDLEVREAIGVPESRRQCGPVATDRSAPARRARRQAARQRPLPDAEIGGGEVSWPPSLQCGRRDALFRLDIGRADYLRPLGGIRLDDDSKLVR